MRFDKNQSHATFQTGNYFGLQLRLILMAAAATTNRTG
jgi:hypothetical protein